MQKEETFFANHIKYSKKLSDEADLSYELHCHERYEIYFISRGNVTFLLEGIEYKPAENSVLLIAPHRFHGLRVLSTEPYERYYIHFSQKLLTDDEQLFLLAPFRQENVMFCNVENYHLNHYLEAIDDCQILENPILDIAIRARLISLLTQLSAISSSAIGGENMDSAGREVLNYINAHLASPLTLESLADQFFMSKNHLTKIFKRMTGTTVANYILQKRMSIARGLIRSGEPAALAAEKAGYPEYSTFYRNYKKTFGCPPSGEQPSMLDYTE